MPATASHRNNELAEIHIAKAKLGWDDDTYRDVMAAVTNGVRSAKDLDVAGRRAFLAHLQACLRQVGQPVPARRKALAPSQARLWALWQSMCDAKLLTDRSSRAVNAWIKRQTDVDQIGWLTPGQAEQAIESLKAWRRRLEGPKA
jgi:phage gp16-like protein